MNNFEEHLINVLLETAYEEGETVDEPEVLTRYKKARDQRRKKAAAAPSKPYERPSKQALQARDRRVNTPNPGLNPGVSHKQNRRDRRGSEGTYHGEGGVYPSYQPEPGVRGGGPQQPTMQSKHIKRSPKTRHKGQKWIQTQP